MLREKRLQQILELLKRDGQVEISVLSKMLDVTEMTIRRDLDSLSATCEIVRTHGGAMLSNEEESIELPYERRSMYHGEQKKKVALKALSLVKHRQILFLDSGSTTYYFAQNFSNDKTNTILTTGINIASVLLSRQNVSVIMIGGDLRRNTLSSCGPVAEEQINCFRVDIAFLGANGFDASGGVYIGNTSERGIKNKVMQMAKEKYLLVDSSKYQRYNLICYAQLREFDGVIVDGEIPQEEIEKLKELGANIIIAD